MFCSHYDIVQASYIVLEVKMTVKQRKDAHDKGRFCSCRQHPWQSACTRKYRRHTPTRMYRRHAPTRTDACTWAHRSARNARRCDRQTKTRTHRTSRKRGVGLHVNLRYDPKPKL